MNDWPSYTISAVAGAVSVLVGALVLWLRTAHGEDRKNTRLHRSEDRADYAALFQQQTALITGLQSQLAKLGDELKEMRSAHISCREESAAQRVEIASLKARVAALEIENAELKRMRG